MEITQTVLKNLQLKYDELNALEQTFTAEEFFALPKEEAKRKFEECLFWFFVDGYSSGILMLDEEGLITDIPNGYEFLDITYPDGQSVMQKFDEYYDNADATKLTTLTESEAHRMYNTGSTQSADDVIKAYSETKKDAQNGANGFRVYKTWMTMMDDRVRDTHWTLEGQTIPYEDDFVTMTGEYGKAPGMFQTAEENANCRCWLSYQRGNA